MTGREGGVKRGKSPEVEFRASRETADECHEGGLVHRSKWFVNLGDIEASQRSQTDDAEGMELFLRKQRNEGKD